MILSTDFKSNIKSLTTKLLFSIQKFKFISYKYIYFISIVHPWYWCISVNAFSMPFLKKSVKSTMSLKAFCTASRTWLFSCQKHVQILEKLWLTESEYFRCKTSNPSSCSFESDCYVSQGRVRSCRSKGDKRLIKAGRRFVSYSIIVSRE